MTTHKHNLNEIYVIHEICFKNIVNKNRYLNGIRVYFFRFNFSEYKLVNIHENIYNFFKPILNYVLHHINKTFHT